MPTRKNPESGSGDEGGSPFEKGCWCVLELMGHRRLGGYVSECTVGGASMIRIDVPEVKGAPAVTQFYAPAALYCITPTTEAIAMALAANARPEPVHRYELPERAGDGEFE